MTNGMVLPANEPYTSPSLGAVSDSDRVFAGSDSRSVMYRVEPLARGTPSQYVCTSSPAAMRLKSCATLLHATENGPGRGSGWTTCVGCASALSVRKLQHAARTAAMPKANLLDVVMRNFLSPRMLHRGSPGRANRAIGVAPIML